MGSSGTGNTNFQFVGEQLDPEAQLYFLRARYYDPATGRFISRDPVKGHLSIPQTLNPYSYSANDPINNIDPSGRDYKVYGGFLGDKLMYVGQTCRELIVRAAEHITSSDFIKQKLIYKELFQVPDLTTARGIEQTYIDSLGKAKNGGQLINQINSIGPNNPILSQAKDQAQQYIQPSMTTVLGGAAITVLEKLVNPFMIFIIPPQFDPTLNYAVPG